VQVPDGARARVGRERDLVEGLAPRARGRLAERLSAARAAAVVSGLGNSSRSRATAPVKGSFTAISERAKRPSSTATAAFF
jgi:hypothetical protein